MRTLQRLLLPIALAACASTPIATRILNGASSADATRSHEEAPDPDRIPGPPIPGEWAVTPDRVEIAPPRLAQRRVVAAADGNFSPVGQDQHGAPAALLPRFAHGGAGHPPGAVGARAVQRGARGGGVRQAHQDQRLSSLGAHAQIMIFRAHRQDGGAAQAYGQLVEEGGRGCGGSG